MAKQTKFLAGGTLRKGHVPNPMPARGIFVNPSTPSSVKRQENAWREPDVAIEIAPGHSAAALKGWAKRYDKKGEKGKAQSARRRGKRMKALERRNNPEGEVEMKKAKRAGNPRRKKRKSRKRKGPKSKRQAVKHAKSKLKKKLRRKFRRKNPVGGYVTAKRKSNPSSSFSDQLMTGIARLASVGAGYMLPGAVDQLTLGKLRAKLVQMWSKTKNPALYADITLTFGTGAIAFGAAHLVEKYGAKSASTKEKIRNFKIDMTAGVLLRLTQSIASSMTSGSTSKGAQIANSLLNLKAPLPSANVLIDASLSKIKLVTKTNDGWVDATLTPVQSAKRSDGVIVDAKTGQILVDAMTQKRLVAGYIDARRGPVNGYVNMQPSVPQTVGGYIDATSRSPRPASMRTNSDYYRQVEALPAPVQRPTVAGAGRRHNRMSNVYQRPF